MKIRSSEWKIRFLYYIYRFRPIQRNKIVFCNYVGKGYGCNPKYIAEECLRRKKNWDLVWLVKDMSAPFPEGIRAVQYDSADAIYELATAAIWIDNQRKLPFHRKRKKQFFIETWHGGGGPMKKIGADNPRNKEDKPYEKTSLHMNRIVNLMISNSACITSIYRSAFLYTGEIMQCGYPRNDILVNQDPRIKERVYQFFELPSDRKTVLYAPTYRSGRQLDKYQLDIQRVVESLTSDFGGEWTLLLRLHPTMQAKGAEMKYVRNSINASEFDDMQELLAASDVLISDYSSTISEFALTGKPIFLYAVDIQDYAVDRDFYWDYYSLPFPIADNNDKLEENIRSFDEQLYSRNVDRYLKDVGMADTGTAASQVVDVMQGVIER